MKVVRINQIDPVQFTGGLSFRAVLEKDNMGFAMMKTVIPKGGPYHWHYLNHLEACYCIRGKAILKDLSTGIEHIITPDVVYVLDNHDDHTLEALEDTVLISVFNPPLTGKETHDKNGVYSSPEKQLI
jgi:L-ectoine synthase